MEGLLPSTIVSFSYTLYFPVLAAVKTDPDAFTAVSFFARFFDLLQFSILPLFPRYHYF